MDERSAPCKALVLAGGGARGSYQVGVWRALMELDWHPQIITGTSVGSLNGAMFVLDQYETARKFTKAEVEHALTELDTGNYGMILRSKGIVNGGADGWLEFDYVPGEWEVRARGADVGGKLVVIGSKLNEKAIAELFGC
mgnify:CR=1 FL=1